MGRAKCRKCNSILESKHRHDYVTCACGAISIDGGLDYMHCRFDEPDNFVMIDDEGNEVIPKRVEEPAPTPDEIFFNHAVHVWENEKDKIIGDMFVETIPPAKPTRNELIAMLEAAVKNIENLPDKARYSAITYADHLSLMYMLLAIFKSDCI